MKSPLIFTSLAVVILASSCDKPRVLSNERALVEAEILRANEEIRNVDAKFEALRNAPISYGMTLDRHLEEAVKKNLKLEAELGSLSQKCAEGEAALSELRPRLESYKASYLR